MRRELLVVAKAGGATAWKAEAALLDAGFLVFEKSSGPFLAAFEKQGVFASGVAFSKAESGWNHDVVSITMEFDEASLADGEKALQEARRAVESAFGKELVLVFSGEQAGVERRWRETVEAGEMAAAIPCRASARGGQRR